jgi:hypothetical protein
LVDAFRNGHDEVSGITPDIAEEHFRKQSWQKSPV